MKLALVILIIQLLGFVKSTELLCQTPKLYGPPGSRTIDLYVNQKNPSIIYASNYEGGLFMSSDYGNTVEAKEVHNKNFQINGIFHSILNNKTFLYASGYFLVNENNTNGWKLVYDDDKYSPRIKHIIVNSFNENVLYMPRYGKEIWRSDDCGENWYLLYAFENDIDRIAIAPSDSSILYAAAFGLYKSIDSGKNWHKIFENYNFGNSAWQMKVNPQNPHSFYLQSGGNLYKAIGEHENVDTTIIYNLSDYIIDPKDTLTMYVAASDPWFGTGGGLMKSNDGGDEWVSIHNGLPLNGTTVRKLAIDPINTNTLYAGTSGHGVYKTTDGGENWIITNLVYDGYFYNYEIIDSKAGEIIFSSGSHNLIKTADKGASWFYPTYFPQENQWVVNPESISFHPLNNMQGYLGDGYNIFETNDGGTTWTKSDYLPGCHNIKYHFFNPNILYARTIDSEAYISRDGGINWNILPGIRTPSYFSSNDESIGYIINYDFVTGEDSIGISKDYGHTWKNYAEGLKTHMETSGIFDITSFEVVSGNPDILYCSQAPSTPENGALNKSEDGGKTWYQIDSSLAKLDKHLNITSIAIDQNQTNRIFIGMKSWGAFFNAEFTTGGLYLTEDDCKTWRKLYDSYTNNIKIDYTTNPKTIYFTTKFGLMSLPDTAHVTSVEDNKTFLPKEFMLHQNYPNPFNPTTTIKYNIPLDVKRETKNVILIVYDILGREVATLVNENQKAGNYEVNFDASHLTSGIYFYKLQGDGLTLVKKMILLR